MLIGFPLHSNLSAQRNQLQLQHQRCNAVGLEFLLSELKHPMPLGSNQVQRHSERIVCGVPVDIYSIVIPDKYDPTAIPNAWQKFWAEFPKSDMPSNNEAWDPLFRDSRAYCRKWVVRDSNPRPGD